MAKQVDLSALDCEANIARAVESGALVRLADHRVSLAPRQRRSSFLQVKIAGDYDCEFLNAFLFRHAYAKQAVPHGCRACYKVKIVPRDLRGLVALCGILEELPYHAKCGVDLHNPFSRAVYAGYLYLVGLPAAQAAWHDVRRRLDATPALGPEVSIQIKRGCSNYEMACGPSDKWTFDGIEEIEQDLKAQYVPRALPPRNYKLARAAMMRVWVEAAWSVGDDTYLEFTNGVPLFPEQVLYSPGPPEASEG